MYNCKLIWALQVREFIYNVRWNILWPQFHLHHRLRKNQAYSVTLSLSGWERHLWCAFRCLGQGVYLYLSSYSILLMNVAFMGESVNEKAGVGFGFPALTACPSVKQCGMRSVFRKLWQKLPSASLPWVLAFCSGSGWSAITLMPYLHQRLIAGQASWCHLEIRQTQSNRKDAKKEKRL